MLCVARIGTFAILEQVLEDAVDVVVYEIDKFCARGMCMCVSGNVCWSPLIPT